MVGLPNMNLTALRPQNGLQCLTSVTLQSAFFYLGILGIEKAPKNPLHKGLTRAQLSAPIPWCGLIISAVIIASLVLYSPFSALTSEMPLLRTPKSYCIRLDGSRGSNSSPYYAAQNIIMRTSQAYRLLVGSLMEPSHCGVMQQLHSAVVACLLIDFAYTVS